MTREYAALAIAAAFALAGLVPLAGRHLGRPLLWTCLLAGAVTGLFALEATKMAWDWLGPIGGLSGSAAGFTVHLLIAVGVGELLKATAPLAAISFAPTDVVAALAYGAASGAGFGFITTQPVLARALELVGSPIVTPLSTAVAFIGWFFSIVANISTTAYVARAGVRGGLGSAFAFAWCTQFVLGAAQRLPVVVGVPGGLLVTALITLAVFGYLWAMRARAVAGAPAAWPARHVNGP